MTYARFRELRANLASHPTRILSDRTELVVKRGRQEPVGIMPLAELEGLRETRHLLSTEANVSHLREGIAERRGEGSSSIEIVACRFLYRR